MDTVGDWLLGQYEIIHNRNQRFSLRAFAQKIEISNSRLIQILQRKRYVSDDLAQKLSEKLDLSVPEREQLMELVQKEEVARNARKAFGPSPAVTSRLVQLDMFAVISDPVHYSILALMETVNFQGNPEWISTRLNRATCEVLAALDRLERIGLIVREPEYALVGPNFVETPTDIPCQSLRDHQRNKIEEGLSALKRLPVKERDHTSITVPVNPEKLPDAKMLIKEFRQKMSEMLSSGDTTEVYHLCIQLFPATRLNDVE